MEGGRGEDGDAQRDGEDQDGDAEDDEVGTVKLEDIMWKKNAEFKPDLRFNMTRILSGTKFGKHALLIKVLNNVSVCGARSARYRRANGRGMVS